MMFDRSVPLVFAIVIATGCSSPAPTTPTAPSAPTVSDATVTGLTIKGLPGSLAIGQSVQLTAHVTLSDGTQKQTSDAMWQSSDKTVATVSPAGILSTVAPGAVDVTASASGVSAKGHVLVGYDITGVVHESAPTEAVFLRGATVRISGGPHDGETTTTDDSGRFIFRGIEAPGFALDVTKSGYDSSRYGIVALPRDQYASIALSPSPGSLVVTEDRSGTAVCTGVLPNLSYSFPIWEFPVHHSGPVVLLEADNIGWGSTEVSLERVAPDGAILNVQSFSILRAGPIGNGNDFVFSAVVPPGGSSLTALGGFMYRVIFGRYADLPPCGPVRGIWTHPN